jgi:hypothetical protein
VFHSNADVLEGLVDFGALRQAVLLSELDEVAAPALYGFESRTHFYDACNDVHRIGRYDPATGLDGS